MEPIRLRVKVVPGASRDEIAGWLGDTLKVRVTAPPERGKANAAVVATIARALGLPLSGVCITAGHLASRKVVAVTGISGSELRQRLGGHGCGPVASE